jgi:predicted transcriptional regulator
MASLQGLGTKPPNHLPTSHCYRDRIYIIKDVILHLVEYGYLNQTSLIRFCGLNLKKHRSILDELEFNAFISRSESMIGHRSITIYKPTQKGIEFCNKIIVPYEKVFPRDKKQQNFEISKRNMESTESRNEVRVNKNRDHSIITTIP